MDATAQPSDTEMSDAAPPQQPPQQQQQLSIPATLSHGGRFIQYNIFGNIFEVTAKYKPPIMPIGKGAYGIVWYFLSLSFSFSLLLWRWCCVKCDWFGLVDLFDKKLCIEFGDE